MTLREAMAVIDLAVPDPTQGLPEEIFLWMSRLSPLINVDLLVQDASARTLLTWRHDKHYGPGWHLPGGIIRYKERAEDRIVATAKEELGAEVDFDSSPLLISETMASGRERGHFISMLYSCRLRTGPDEALLARADPPPVGYWKWHEHAPGNLISEQRQYACHFRS